LYVRSRNPRVRLAPILVGGGQERGMRSGTLNVPGIVALGAAARISVQEMAEESRRLRLLRGRLFRGITSELSGVTLNGPLLPALDERGDVAGAPDAAIDARLPGNLNCSFAGVEGEALVLGMKDIAVSSGSACTSASLQPSHVLRAVGVPDDLAHASIRFGLGRFTTAEEIDFAISSVAATVRRLRELTPAPAVEKSVS
jgi:cysteine desulfurase